MKIFIVCSTKFYDKVDEISEYFKSKGFDIIYPNGYNDLKFDDEISKLSGDALYKFKGDLIKTSENKASEADILLVLNYDKEKNGIINKNYIGGATFLEIYNAYRFGKKIYFYNDIPNGVFEDELKAFFPIVINGDLDKIK